MTLVNTRRGLAWRAAALMGAITLAACGSGGNANSAASSAPLAANVVPITVAQGLDRVANIGTVSVTICAAGNAAQCQTLDNIQLDTGSYGLRVVAAELSPTLRGALQQATVPNSNAPLASCALFADGYSFGSVRIADVTLGGRTASAIPIHLIGDSKFPTVPSDCVVGRSENAASELHSRGILGVGAAAVDCGNRCATNAAASSYFNCASASNCVQTVVPLAQQIAKPVANVPVDNNGVIVDMPAIGPSGQSSVSGTLLLGIGTASNNRLGSGAMVLTTDDSGSFSATYNGSRITGFTDTGSNGLFFTDASLPVCGSGSPFYCPPGQQAKLLTVTGANGATQAVNLNVGNASMLLSTPNTFALNDLAGPMPRYFDLGMPFFYGRRVAVAISGKSTPSGNGPYVAF
ncbi:MULTISPECIES: DUF3443 domain-containing protein [Mycetohabitans]|uniref:Uncharacterized protein DUF3443 n=1 Tax=Mycetohabitans endofungorum TaxID=417203 RepID=A0A2P5K8E2_9BURK|nr:DUF3443 domain-containing protein [Mycetohabitans endofungorum]PPB82998.1 uncharacterized protein DUF3443 [Mycetohabitans endofungorum]